MTNVTSLKSPVFPNYKKCAVILAIATAINCFLVRPLIENVWGLEQIQSWSVQSFILLFALMIGLDPTKHSHSRKFDFLFPIGLTFFWGIFTVIGTLTALSSQSASTCIATLIHGSLLSLACLLAAKYGPTTS